MISNLIIYFLYFISFILNSNFKKILSLCLIIISVSFVNYFEFNKINLDKNNELNNHKSEIINFLKKNEFISKNKKILVTDEDIFVWLVLNEYNNFSYVPKHFWTVRSNETLQDDFIKLMKFFGLKSSDYEKILSNKKKDFRMQNSIALSFLGRKYIANSLYTFEESEDFEDLNFIKKIKPTISHSFAIPNYEKKKLVYRYHQTNSKIEPNILIIQKNNKLFNSEKLYLKNYCILKENYNYILLEKKNKC